MPRRRRRDMQSRHAAARRRSSGSRPGEHLPSGSNAARTRAASRAFGSGDPEPVEPGRARLAQQPAARAGRRRASLRRAPVRRRRPRARCRRRPRRPAHAGRGRARRPAPRSADGRTEIAAAVRAVGPAAAHRPRVDGPSIAARSARRRRRRLRAARACACRPTRGTTVGTGRAARANGSASVTNHSRVVRARLAAQRDLHEDADRAERADEQAREVEAADVLHRRAAALHDAAVGGDEPHFEHAVAQRAVAEPATTREAGGQQPADRRVGVARVERALLAFRAEHRGRARRTCVPAPTVTVRSAGS